MNTIRFKLYDKLLDNILGLKFLGGEHARNVIMKWPEHREFIRACQAYGDSQSLKMLFQDMGIKKVIIIWNLIDNPFLWLRVISLMRRSVIRIGLTWNIKWKYDQKKKHSLSTIYLYDKKGEPYSITGDANKLNDPYDLKSTGSCLCIRQLRYLMYIGEDYKKSRVHLLVKNLPNYFNSIAVLGNNKLAEYACHILLKAGVNVKHIKTTNDSCYQLSVKEKFDVILNMTFAPFVIKYHKEPVYTMSIYSILTQLPETSTDIDIANKIIPQLQKNGIKVVTAALPCWPDKNMTQSETLKNAVAKRSFLIEKGMLSRFYPLSFSAQYYAERKEIRYLYDKGYMAPADQTGKLINFIHGMRYTCGNQISTPRRILMFGPCTIWGVYVTDSNTIPSIIKKNIGELYEIENHGGSFWNMNLQIRSESYCSGDIAIIFIRDKCLEYYKKRHIPVLNLDTCFDSVPKLETHFTDYIIHCDHLVNKRIAETIADYLEANHLLDNSDCIGNECTFRLNQIKRENILKKYERNADITNWLNRIRSDHCWEGKTGAIVMNCNPFTLGHRYLIEQACAQVDRLIIFVVEEDKSFFKFKDRIAMVRLGTADLDKVTVIPSGKYIISAVTLPGYFEKDDNPDIVLNATDDLDLFSEVIAKELNISVRFAGEEPIDAYTRQYNQAMSKVLPEHGIEFIEIPRREHNGSVISASRVRKLMDEKRYEEIKKLVIPKVYAYLEEHYFQRTKGPIYNP